jgi:hypothetical protein
VDDEPVNSIRDALRQSEAETTAPIVDYEREPVEADRIDERLEPRLIALDRVVEVLRFGRLAEAGQIGRDPADSRQERDPLPGRRRHPVEVEDGRATVARSLTPMRRKPGDLTPSLDHL